MLVLLQVQKEKEKEQRENYMNLQENKAAASKRTLDLFIGGKTGQYSGKVSPRG